MYEYDNVAAEESVASANNAVSALQTVPSDMNRAASLAASVNVSGLEFLKRPDIHYADLYNLVDDIKDIELDNIGISQLETIVKYEGYIKKQQLEAESYLKFENYKLPSDLDYMNLDGLRLEARQKLDKIKPLTIGQASRISGVNPSDISILILLLKKLEK